MSTPFFVFLPPLHTYQYSDRLYAGGSSTTEITQVSFDTAWLEAQINKACDQVRQETAVAILQALLERQALLDVVRTLAPDVAKVVEEALAARVALQKLDPGAKP